MCLCLVFGIGLKSFIHAYLTSAYSMLVACSASKTTRTPVSITSYVRTYVHQFYISSIISSLAWLQVPACLHALVPEVDAEIYSRLVGMHLQWNLPNPAPL